MTIAVNDIVRITARMSFLGNDVQNIYHVKATLSDQGGDADWMDDFSVILDDAYTEIVGELSTGLNFDDIIGQNLTQDVVLPATAWPVLTVGQGTGDAMAPQVCALAFWQTTTPRVIGRKFLGPWAETSGANGALSAALIIDMVAYAVDISLWAMASPLDRDAIVGTWRPTLGPFTPLGLSAVNGTFMTQRRRTIGRGS